jgi:hypothetical protein
MVRYWNSRCRACAHDIGAAGGVWYQRRVSDFGPLIGWGVVVAASVVAGAVAAAVLRLPPRGAALVSSFAGGVLQPGMPSGRVRLCGLEPSEPSRRPARRPILGVLCVRAEALAIEGAFGV